MEINPYFQSFFPIYGAFHNNIEETQAPRKIFSLPHLPWQLHFSIQSHNPPGVSLVSMHALHVLLFPSFFFFFSASTQVPPSLWLPRLFCSPSKQRIEAKSFGPFFLSKFLGSVKCIMSILYVFANNYLSVGAYNVCPFGYGLFHPG